jgi:hypothetical protein
VKRTVTPAVAKVTPAAKVDRQWTAETEALKFLLLHLKRWNRLPPCVQAAQERLVKLNQERVQLDNKRDERVFAYRALKAQVCAVRHRWYNAQCMGNLEMGRQCGFDLTALEGQQYHVAHEEQQLKHQIEQIIERGRPVAENLWAYYLKHGAFVEGLPSSFHTDTKIEEVPTSIALLCHFLPFNMVFDPMGVEKLGEVPTEPVWADSVSSGVTATRGCGMCHRDQILVSSSGEVSLDSD